ncbi:tetratricopeptide repeat-containing diguanylate cyclase [Parachitinimonas caeni]|uniref:diguanylate cyclase n=1 Tax=Parachitinimonas caeni TaxID=3031301 RepID=A0ABT7DTD5_9NEIS|nr:diguanylate cyclase [Parachitinimonas caeni]MDK2123296.1 diguanylate cyclase [Parachitinimonas caeni]
MNPQTFPTAEAARLHEDSAGNAVSSLNEEAWRLQYQDPTRSQELAEAARALAVSRDDAMGCHYADLTLAFFAIRYGRFEEGVARLRELLLLAPVQADERARMIALCGQAIVESRFNRQDQAYALALEAADLAERVGRLFDQFVVYNTLGVASFETGRNVDGLRYLYRTLDVARQDGSPSSLAIILSNLGSTQHELGNYEDAKQLLLEAMAVVSNHRLENYMQLVAGNLAASLLISGDPEGAYDIIRPFLSQKRQITSGGDYAFFEAIAAHTFASRGDWELATDYIENAQIHAEAAHEVRVGVHCWWVKGLILRGLGQLAASLEALQMAESKLVGLQDLYYACQVMRETAETYALIGDWQQAYRYHRRHHELYEQHLGNTSRARLQTLQIQNELIEAKRERDFARLKQAEAERAQRELEALNDELKHKVEQIERLQNALREQVIRDPLTDLYNRRYLHDELFNELKLAERRFYTLCVVLMDVDHFKSVNDRFGHPAGDKVLMALAHLLRENIRGSDFASRYGGEEFCIVMADISVEQAVGRVNKLLGGFRDATLTLDGLALGGLTFSAGVAGFPHHGRDSESLLQAADAALYRAKAGGRNRIEVAP